MSLEKLISQIEEETDKKANLIIDKARKEAEEIIATAKKNATRKAEEINREGEKTIERIREKILAATRREARSNIIQLKEEIIQECFERAKEYLKQIKGKEYEKIVLRLMQEGKKVLGTSIVIPSRNVDKKIASRLGLETQDSTTASGGIIMKSRDGTKEINYTFDALLDLWKEKLRIEIAEVLFKEKGEKE